MATNLNTDPTGVPVEVSNAVDPNFGTPPSVNPALTDPNTGALLAIAQPDVVKPPFYEDPIFWLSVGAWWLWYESKKR